MSTRSKLFTTGAALAASIMLCACDGSVRREGPVEPLLRITRTDAERNRLWALDEKALTLYDKLNRRLLRRVILPEWVLAGEAHACAPDVVLDAAGAVFVSSNVVPVLWRVDPQSFEVTRIALTLDSDRDKDVGFTGLSFAGDGTLIATGATFPSQWRIDIGAARASKVASSASLADALCGT